MLSITKHERALASLDQTFNMPGVIKHKEEDFQVNESYLIDQSLDPCEAHHLFILKKCGFSTFDAVRVVREFFKLAPDHISYYGLKDEDAITQQLINLEIHLNLNDVLAFNAQFTNEVHYIHLTYLQPSPHRLKVGGLISNNFLLTIRKLPYLYHEVFAHEDLIQLHFINYYGVQRFSLPNEKPISHLIGRAILEKNHQEAFEKVASQSSKLGNAARLFKGEPSEFFSNIDCREKNFFINSYYSWYWNEELKNLLSQQPIRLGHYQQKNLTYLFATSNELRKIHLNDALVQTKVMADDKESKLCQTMRPAILQVFFQVVNVKEDECFPQHCKVQLKFSLPKGCYATMAIAQLLYQMDQGSC